MPTPTPKKMNRKTLMAAMAADREEKKALVKSIAFAMPDLKGPGGNAFALLGEAAHLMKRAGIPEAARSVFHTDATSGDYEHLLRTIAVWFTVVVAVTEYVPVTEDQFEALISNRQATEDDESLEASELAAQEKYEGFDDPEEQEVLDLRGMTPAESMQAMAEHAAKKGQEDA